MSHTFSRWVFTPLAVLLAVSVSLPAHSLIARHRKGLQVGIRGGLNQCVDDADATCEGTTLGGGFGGIISARFLPYLSVGVDTGVYMFGQDVVDTLSLTNFIFEVRAYLPLQRLDVYGKFGGGYMRMNWEWGTNKYSESSWVNMKWGGGATYFFLERHRFGDMGIGIDIDFLWTNLKDSDATDGVTCIGCNLSGDTGSGINAMQYSIHWVWVIPMFGSAGNGR